MENIMIEHWTKNIAEYSQLAALLRDVKNGITTSVHMSQEDAERHLESAERMIKVYQNNIREDREKAAFKAWQEAQAVEGVA